jgi:hypothetical protein
MDHALRELLAQWFNSEGGDFQGANEIHDNRKTQTKLISFALQFVEFSELLLNSQRYGTTYGTEAKYGSLKQQLVSNYAGLRPFLLAYLRFDLEDERIGLRTLGIGTDAFEASWVADSLKAFVESDDVFLRDRVARANEAINDYTEHLHCLLETRV